MSRIKFNTDLPAIPKRKIMPTERRMTPRIMTKYEFTKIIGWRAEALSNGARTIDHEGNEYQIPESVAHDPILIAEWELINHKLNISLMRPVNYRGEIVYEIFNLYDSGGERKPELEINVI